MLTHIKKWSYNRKLQERITKVRNLPDDQFNIGARIGILCEIENLEDLTVIYEFKKKLKYEGRLVKTLSYIDQKMDVTSFAQRTISKNDIRWDGVPESSLVDEFLNWNTDMLICPIKNMRDCYSYIIKLSSSKFKVGLNCKDAENLYDMIIDMGFDKPLDEMLNEILNQLKTVSY